MDKLRQDTSIGGNLRALRKAHGYTQERLVAKLQLLGSDTTRPIYSRYETGELNIKISDLRHLQVIYQCSYDAFFM
ncbi:helix-turn-helix transcriptional regulator [Bengtsoniella intestinalis]|uniref:helix-turn-helix domain-containing protein n=1 Tax=Bengtsoniella intestinalis TaxID=3073143 RepID=UPI00391EEC9A